MGGSHPQAFASKGFPPWDIFEQMKGLGCFGNGLGLALWLWIGAVRVWCGPRSRGGERSPFGGGR
jgi:hypothetical protein